MVCLQPSLFKLRTPPLTTKILEPTLTLLSLIPDDQTLKIHLQNAGRTHLPASTAMTPGRATNLPCQNVPVISYVPAAPPPPTVHLNTAARSILSKSGPFTWKVRPHHCSAQMPRMAPISLRVKAKYFPWPVRPDLPHPHHCHLGPLPCPILLPPQPCCPS